MSNKTFNVGGVSKSKSGYKVRFANDMTRVKILAKTDSDIQMDELPNAMTKSELVAFLKTTNLYSNNEYRAAIDAADEKYNAEVKVSGAKVKAQPNMADIKSRAAKAAA
jgi:predicted ATP-binding protein involved in virulence